MKMFFGGFLILNILFDSCIQGSALTAGSFTTNLTRTILSNHLERICKIESLPEEGMPVIKLSDPKVVDFPQQFVSELRAIVASVQNRVYTRNGRLEQTGVSDVCYRGQRDSSRKLQSALARLSRNEHPDKTTYLLAQFIPHDAVLSEQNPISQLSYLQHYGVETPLLDWTKNPEIALYYGTYKFLNETKEKQKNATASLYILDPYGLNEEYRLSKHIGCRVGGLALTENFDAIIRGRHSLTHSLFELSCDPIVRYSAEKDGIELHKDEILKVQLLRDIDRKEYKDKDLQKLVNRALSGPIAVFPKWAKANERVRVLQSIFTIDGLSLEEATNSSFDRHVVKLDFDHTLIESILRHYKSTAVWRRVKSLESTHEDKSFNTRQTDFREMMSGGFK